MELNIVKEALGLDETADSVQVLERIQELRAEAGESFEKEPADLVLIRKGEHEQCAQNPDGSITVTLLEPIVKGSITTSEITLRRTRLKDLRKAEEMSKGNPLANLAAMIHLLSHPSQAQSIIDDLDAADLGVFTSVIRFLSGPRRRTGA